MSLKLSRYIGLPFGAQKVITIYDTSGDMECGDTMVQSGSDESG